MSERELGCILATLVLVFMECMLYTVAANWRWMCNDLSLIPACNKQAKLVSALLCLQIFRHKKNHSGVNFSCMPFVIFVF